MADTSAAGQLTASWDGVTPATAPAGSIVLLAPGRDATVGIDVRGTFVATITLETSVDGLNWSAPSVTTLAGAGSTATFSAPGSRLVAVSGAALLRARCSAYTSGTATVVMSGTPGGGGGASGGGGGGAATIADGADVAEGTTTDAGIITDTSGTVIGFLRGAILRWNTFLGRFPAALGGTTSAASLPVTLSTDGPFATQTGSVTETAPATDTASSGLNGRLQRIAQRLTTLLPQNAGRLNVDGAGGTFPATGTLTTNNAAPGANNLGVLPAVANAVSPTYVEGDQVLQSVTLSGHQRSVIQGFQAAGVAIASNPVLQGVSDGANIQTVKQATAATGTTGTGLPGVGPVIWDAVGTTNFVKQAGDGSGRAMVVGAAAAAAAVTGNPVLIGGSDGTNAQNVKTALGVLTTQGQAGILTVVPTVYAGSNDFRAIISAAQIGDNNTGSNTPMSAVSLYNGSGWDKQRNNIDVTLLASAARTTTQTSADQISYNAHGVLVTLDVTATVSTVSLTVAINYKDPASGKYIPLLTGTTVAAAGTTTYWVNPQALASVPAPYTKTAQADLGRIFNVTVTVGNANSQTYSLGMTTIN